MGFAFPWLLFSIAVGVWAANRGRHGFGWFLIACFISPLIAAIFLAVTVNKASVLTSALGPSEATHVRCSVCAEFVLPQAMKCKHCGADLVPDPEFEQRIAAQKIASKDQDARNLFIGIGFIAVLIALAKIVSWFIETQH